MHELGTKYKEQLGGTNTLPKSGCTPRSLEKPIKNKDSWHPSTEPRSTESEGPGRT